MSTVNIDIGGIRVSADATQSDAEISINGVVIIINPTPPPEPAARPVSIQGKTRREKRSWLCEVVCIRSRDLSRNWCSFTIRLVIIRQKEHEMSTEKRTVAESKRISVRHVNFDQKTTDALARLIIRIADENRSKRKAK